MSEWAHFNGNIRFDDLRIDKKGESPTAYIEKALGKIVNYTDKSYKTSLPYGSEGSIRYDIIENPIKSSIAAYSVSIWGDLRDYEREDLPKVKTWFNDILTNKNLIIRNAVLTVSFSENVELILYSAETDDFKTIMKEIIIKGEDYEDI